jgi:hypothetical protein
VKSRHIKAQDINLLPIERETLGQWNDRMTEWSIIHSSLFYVNGFELAIWEIASRNWFFDPSRQPNKEWKTTRCKSSTSQL